MGIVRRHIGMAETTVEIDTVALFWVQRMLAFRVNRDLPAL